MRIRQAGQAFVLVLILLAVGAATVVPALRLTDTSLRSSAIAVEQTRLLYAADAAQEYVLWKLLHDAYGGEFTEGGQEGYLSLDCCGVDVNLIVVMRAIPGKEGGLSLSTDDVIQPAKSVSPDSIPNNTYETVTYILRLEQISSNISQGLDVIYDILPDVFDDSDFVTGSSEMRIDGGSWLSIPDPNIEAGPARWRLRWPASGNFSSDSGNPNYFNGMRDFAVRQVKEVRFQMAHDFTGSDNNLVHCNWVVLKPWNTISGPQAPLSIGNPADPNVCDDDGMLEVAKSSDPEIIQPGIEADIEYTVSITNQDGFTHQIEEIIDYLPSGFTYCSSNTTPACPAPSGNITTDEPQLSFMEVNGVERWKVHWVFSPAVSIKAGETLSLIFSARTTKDVSGSYYNEVQVISDVPIPQIFQDVGITGYEYYTCYSWNTGSVTVPTYDSRAEAGGVVLDANMAMIIGSIAITGYEVR
jgi:hypothetical protein